MTVIDCIGKYVDQAKARVPIFTNEIYNYVEMGIHYHLTTLKNICTIFMN